MLTEIALKEVLKRHGFIHAGHDDIYYPPFQASAAHSAWSNWGRNSKISSLTKVDYE